MECRYCGDSYIHLLGNLEVVTNDMDNATQLIVNGTESIPIDEIYPYRSQGNIHLIFSCEMEGHISIISYDGHKGNVFVNDNVLIQKLEDYLNANIGQSMWRFNDYLFNTIKDFFSKDDKQNVIDYAKYKKRPRN